MAKRSGSAVLTKIRNEAKRMLKKHPGSSYQVQLKKAGAKYRSGQLGKVRKKRKPAKKKHHAKKNRRVSAVKNYDRVDRKRTTVNIGGMSVAQARRYIVNEAKEKLAWALLARDNAGNKTERKKKNKRVIALRHEVRKFS